MKENTYPRSIELYRQAKQYFVGGVASSLHKAKSDEHPIYIEKGRGSKVWDVDGNEYIDYVGGFGPLILGYRPETVDQAVIEQIHRGTVFAAPNELLNMVSAKLIKAVPCAQIVAYQSTGTEANMLAFRIARAYTGKNKIVRFEGHYHGWSDEQLISNAPDSLSSMGPRNKPWRVMGSPGQLIAASEDVIVLPWNDPDLLETVLRRQGREIAAVVTEPLMCNCEVVYPKPGFLEALRGLTRKHEVLLIFDEVITGFRLALGGAQEYFDVTPDLGVFGKAMAAGYPAVRGHGQQGDHGIRSQAAGDLQRQSPFHRRLLRDPDGAGKAGSVRPNRRPEPANLWRAFEASQRRSGFLCTATGRARSGRSLSGSTGA